MAAGQAAVATAASHLPVFNTASQEIYFTCKPYTMGSHIEISPGGWAETLPSFDVIEVRKRSKWESSIRAVREQAELSEVQGSNYDYDYGLYGGRDGPA